MAALRWAGAVAGAALVVATWASLLQTLVVPRGTRTGLARVVAAATRRLFLGVAGRPAPTSGGTASSPSRDR